MTEWSHTHFSFLGMVVLSGVHPDSFNRDLEKFQSSYQRTRRVCTLISVRDTRNVPVYISAHPPAALGCEDSSSRVMCILRSPGNLDRLS